MRSTRGRRRRQFGSVLTRDVSSVSFFGALVAPQSLSKLELDLRFKR